MPPLPRSPSSSCRNEGPEACRAPLDKLEAIMFYNCSLFYSSPDISPWPRPAPSFICQNCGAVAPRWQGKCESCNEWNSLVEEAPSAGIGALAARDAKKGRIFALEGLTGDSKPAPRLLCGLSELDRVTGGGFVPGSVLLIGGEPGIGKSTLLIQVCAALARRGERVVYISGEEAVAQVRLRAERLGLADAAVELAAETSVEDIIATLSARHGAAAWW